MRALHENQQKILEHLLNRPDGSTLEELSAVLGVTKTATREHLIKIESLGYLKYVDSKGDVGRPRRRYLLSGDGHDVFPKQYSWLSNVILELLAEDLGAKQAALIMNKLAYKVADSMAARFENKNSAEVLLELNKTMNELGYRTSLKQSDLRKGAVIEATNCVYHSVAKEHPELCQFDIQFIKKTTGFTDVKLESCIARGGSVCRFCIRKK